MGKIVAAMGTVHAPQLFTYPPSEDPKQLDADIAAMRQLGKSLEEAKPDLAIVIGSDHLETFFLSSSPTFAIVGGKKSRAEFARREYSLAIHPLAEQLMQELVDADFDMTYSQDAVLGHAFAAVYEWVIEGRAIPVVPLFVNTYLPPLPRARRCAQLGAAMRKVIDKSDLRVAIIASGGLSHYPGTWKYPQPAYDFDWWAIAHMERGSFEPLIGLTSSQLDQVGNTEFLPWMVMFGAIGSQPGELLTYQPTWHHGHAVMRFLPHSGAAPSTPEPAPAWKFENEGGYEFYRHPDPDVYPLNKVLYDLRFSSQLRRELFADTPGLAAKYGLTTAQATALETMKDDSIDMVRSLKPHPVVDAGAHPLGFLMSLIVVQSEQRRMRQEAQSK
jgi:aromatic ring-opening dioxygenase catalytic subunit (LigB family)